MFTRLAFTITLLVMSAATAFACPTVDGNGEKVTYSGDDLFSEKSISVRAGGDDVGRCKLKEQDGTSVSGYFADNPDVELRYSDNGGYKLRFWVDGDCDTKVLVNTGAGNWFYDDDGGPGNDAQMTITGPSDGTYDIWVGTNGSNSCDAVLKLETFKTD